MNNGGVDTEADYPYLAHDDKCMCGVLLFVILLAKQGLHVGEGSAQMRSKCSVTCQLVHLTAPAEVHVRGPSH